MTAAPATPPAEITPIRRSSLHDEVVGRVRDLIVEGKLVGGTRVHEGRLCEQLGVSRTPLREALKVLANEGLVDLLPNRGAVVRQVTAKDTRDMLRVLGRLEALAGELACANATDEEIAALRAVHERMMAHHAAGNIMEYFKLNQQIHGSIVRIARNPTLQSLHESLQARVRRIRFVPHDFGVATTEPLREHERMMEALARRDGAALGKLLDEHMEMTWRRVSRSLGFKEP
ncbi:MAG TPA: GntR family transcriptional regulator [Alphaproteobacteria bacterium]|nr:GntR family transcriptional regulator [Alphaproteobacteria bacterium]